MKLGYTILYVPDVAAALSFYEGAFGLTRRFLDEAGQYGELDTGNTVLAFASEALAARNELRVRPNRPGDEPGGFELAFVTTDVEAALQRALNAGARPVKPPTKQPWGQVVAYLRDLHGVLIELCTPMG